MHAQTPVPSLTYLRPTALPGIEVLLASHSTCLWRMFHERYMICAARHAATIWSYRSRLYFMNDGGTAFIEPGETHCGRASRKPASFVAVFLDTALFRRLAKKEGCTSAPHFPLPQVRDPRHFIATYEFANAVREKATALGLQTRLALLTRLALEYAGEKPAAFGDDAVPRQLMRARDFLRERFQENISLDDLAAVAALSPFHLVRSFSKRFGMPPHAYQIHLRIERARELLRGGMPPGMAAPLVGFADQSHFDRRFKKIMGVTPSEYAGPVCRPIEGEWRRVAHA